MSDRADKNVCVGLNIVAQELGTLLSLLQSTIAATLLEGRNRDTRTCDCLELGIQALAVARIIHEKSITDVAQAFRTILHCPLQGLTYLFL